MRWLPLLFLVAAGCRQDMHDAPRYEPFEASEVFPDGRSERSQVPGTVARGELQEDDHLYRGRVNGELASTFPFRITSADMKRGRERFDIFCSPCHGALGDGRGMLVQRGFPKPPSFHIQRLRDAPPGHFFDVITRGFGRMFDYSDRIPARDRWCITAYIRALQRSTNTPVAELSKAERRQLEATP